MFCTYVGLQYAHLMARSDLHCPARPAGYMKTEVAVANPSHEDDEAVEAPYSPPAYKEEGDTCRIVSHALRSISRIVVR